MGLAEAPALDGVLAANDELGLAMLASAETPNVIVSPVSLVVALSMLAEGARGETAATFDDALGATGAERTASVGALRDVLLRHDGDPAAASAEDLPDDPLLHLATRALLDDDLVPEQDYLDALSGGYDAMIETTDLEVPAAKATLDEWVRRETGGLIEESAITPAKDLRLVLQDAIVFAARWLVPFDPGSTYDDTFTGPNRSDARVPTLHGSSNRAWGVVDVEGWRSVRMPYASGFVADLVLPPDGADPAAIPSAVLASLRTGSGGTVVVTPEDDTEVVVSLPVLDLEPDALDLAPALDGAGLGGLFETPDLSGITSVTDLRLSQAFQQGVLTLDEEGTVAAAVTELAAEESSAQVPGDQVEVRFDRPFLVRLAHEETGATLFLAAVREP